MSNYPKYFVSPPDIRKPFYSWDELSYMIIHCYIRMIELRKEFKVTLKTGADS